MRGERGVTHKTLEQETTAHVPFQPRKTVLELFKVVFVFWEQLRSHYFFSLNPNMWQGLCPNKAGQPTYSGSPVQLRLGMEETFLVFIISFLTVNCFVRPESILVLSVYIRSVFSIPTSSQKSEHDPVMTHVSPPHLRTGSLPAPASLPQP